MFANMRGWEWVIILVIVLLLFGARRLPDLARSVGRSMKIFKTEVKDLNKDAPPTPPPTADPAPPVETTDPVARTGRPAGPPDDDDGERSAS